MENSEEREKEIVRNTLSYYNKGPVLPAEPHNNAGNDNFKKIINRKVMKQYSLWMYVVGVVVVLAIVNLIAMSQSVAIFSGGFLAGMLAMYIAVHLYKYK